MIIHAFKLYSQDWKMCQTLQQFHDWNLIVLSICLTLIYNQTIVYILWTKG